MKIDPNSPVFPSADVEKQIEAMQMAKALGEGADFAEVAIAQVRAIHPGLTIRAHVAAQALAGLLACPEPMTQGVEYEVAVQRLAIAAVTYADALIAELNKETCNAD